MKIKNLIESLEKALVVKKGKYSYIIHPITDGIPEIMPKLLEEVVHEMQIRIEKCRPIDKIVTMEAMGIPLATVLSINMDIPFSIIRKRKYDLSDEINVNQETGYSKSKLYINGLKKGDRIVIVDDVLSTGGTLIAVLTALQQIGVVVKEVFIAIDKGNVANKIMNETKVKITAIANIDIVNGKVVIK